MLLFLLLAITLPRASWAQSEFLSTPANNSDQRLNDIGRSSPLMLEESPQKKSSNYSSPQKTPDKNDDVRPSNLSLRSPIGTPENTIAISSVTAADTVENSLTTWELVDWHKKSEGIFNTILSGNVTLKNAISTEDLVNANRDAATLRSNVQQALEAIKTEEKEINDPTLEAFSSLPQRKMKAFTQKTSSAFPQRNVVLENGGQSNPVQQAIICVEECGSKIIETLQHLPADGTEEQKKQLAHQIKTTTALVQKMQQFMLGCHTSFYITTAKNELINLFNQTPSKGFQELGAFFEKTRAELLFSEPESSEEALDGITNIIKECQSKIEILNPILLSAENSPALLEGKEDFRQAAQQKKDFLQRARLIYEQLQNELTIATECGSLPDLKNSIDQDLENLKSIDQPEITEKLNKMEKILNDPEFQISGISKNALEFVSDINSLDEIPDGKIISGENGKIILTENSILSENDNLKKWINGTDLIRFALARKYGMKAVESFDDHFALERAYEICLSTERVKKFLKDKISIPPSHFLSPLTSMEKLMKRLNRAHNEEFIKWNEEVFKFNPFEQRSIISSEEDLETIHKRELLAGIQHAKQALEKKLATFSISENRINLILKRFDKQFSKAQSLTVGALRTFMTTEEEKIKRSPTHFWEDYVTDSIRNGLISGTVSGMASVTVALFAHHLLTLNLYCFSIGVIVGFILSHIILPMLL